MDEPYNYDRFDAYVESGAAQREFAAFPDLVHAGDPAPDFTATGLDDGDPVVASDLWKRDTVVMEFGSFT